MKEKKVRKSRQFLKNKQCRNEGHKNSQKKVRNLLDNAKKTPDRSILHKRH